jgi:hypothetical protein
VGGDPLADGSPRQVWIAGVGDRWAALDEQLAGP